MGSVIITAQETGGNVVFTLTGSVNLTGAGTPLGAGSNRFINPSVPALGFIVSSSQDSYTVPTSAWSLIPFGTGSSASPGSSSGSVFYMSGGSGTNSLILPQGYTSGASLSATMTFNSATLASLGIVRGTYVYDLTFNGGSAQNITLNAVPEPSTVGLLAMAVATCGAGVVYRLRRRWMLSGG